MIKKTYLGLTVLILFLFFAQKLSAQNYAIGVTFHLFGSSHTDEDLFDELCEINNNYNEPVQSGVHFYVYNIIRNPVLLIPPGKTPQQAAINASHKQGEINIYFINSGGIIYDGTLDAIFSSAIDASRLTHEMGHLLGLRHPEGNNGTLYCTTCVPNGDPDCLPSTPVTPNGNWMNQGTTSGFFTSEQVGPGTSGVIQKCINNRLWGGLIAGNKAVKNNYSYILPFDHFDVNTGIVTFSYSTSNCSSTVLPDMIDILVTTGCPSSYIPYYMPYSTNNVGNSVQIDLGWGLKEIKYTYHYPNSPFTNEIIRTGYDIQGINSCSDQSPVGSKYNTSVNNFYSGENMFQLLDNNNTINTLNVNSRGYKRIVIYSVSGKKIYSQAIKDGETIIDISYLPAGTYIINGIDGTLISHQRFIKQ